MSYLAGASARRWLLVLVLLPLVLAEDDTRCCWCGKRYVPKEGYFEGSAASGVECPAGLSDDRPTAAQSRARHGATAHGGRLGLDRARHALRTPSSGFAMGFPMGWFASWGGWLVRRAVARVCMDLTLSLDCTCDRAPT
jgi:hypothetical protein